MAGVVGGMPQESGSAASSESSASDAQAGSRIKGLKYSGMSPVAAPSEPAAVAVSNWPFGSGIALMKSVPGRLKALALSLTAHYWGAVEAAPPDPIVVDVQLPLGRVPNDQDFCSSSMSLRKPSDTDYRGLCPLRNKKLSTTAGPVWNLL